MTMVDRRRVMEAQQRIAGLEAFYVHLAIYVAVMALLVAVNYFSGDGWWVQWVILGWGIGVLAHAFGIYGRKPRFITHWERRKLREMDR
jgi:hypothetical protein